MTLDDLKQMKRMLPSMTQKECVDLIPALVGQLIEEVSCRIENERRL